MKKILESEQYIPQEILNIRDFGESQEFYRETEKKDGTRMRYDFLKHFPKRMKHVGLYAVLFTGPACKKTTWQKYGFVRADEQINLIFAVLLYIMEQSLKEEYCTKDDIGVFIDELNMGI